MTKEKDALQYILDAWVNHFRMPSNKEMTAFLGDTKIWVNIRGELMKKNILLESDIYDFMIDEKYVAEYKRLQLQVDRPTLSLINSPDYFVPVSIPLLGTVKAGKLSFDELKLDLSPSGDVILLPDVELGQEVYGLEVVGESMVSDHILPDDVIIVEHISLGEIKDGDLIVAKYLNEKFNDLENDQIDLAMKDPSNFNGPTIKYVSLVEYHKKIRGRLLKDTIFRLSPKNKDNEYTIQTRAFEENSLGRVVALHRPIRRL